MTDGAVEAAERLRALLLANHDGMPVGVPSVCSAEPTVLSAALTEAQAAGGVALIESTCNQVNQDGGYTGLTPTGFRAQVEEMAAGAGLAPSALVLGGDHLGPYPWRSEPAEVAMRNARELVRACVTAGYTKLHLDPSMPLGDDRGAVDDATILRRTVDLCAVAEEARAALREGSSAPLYVIGTEVPAPGGEQAGDEGPTTTRPEDVLRFARQAEDAFADAGLDDAWRRVVAVVVQPGVEFDEWRVTGYRPDRAQALPPLLSEVPRLVYEAHSTDYQTEEALAALVRDHFAILKVGPALTFAFREALFALEQIESEMLARQSAPGAEPSRLRETLDAAMRADPSHWQAYHAGADEELRFARAFSYSDRARYYWPRPEVRGALSRLLGNLSARPIPLALLSQYLPEQFAAVRSGVLTPSPQALVTHKIRAVLAAYWRACGAVASH